MLLRGLRTSDDGVKGCCVRTLFRYYAGAYGEALCEARGVQTLLESACSSDSHELHINTLKLLYNLAIQGGEFGACENHCAHVYMTLTAASQKAAVKDAITAGNYLSLGIFSDPAETTAEVLKESQSLRNTIGV